MAFTYFFRDVQTLELICEHALPTLKTRRNINIWDAGCAMGHEPYTLAILVREQVGYMYFRNIKIIGTDIDGSNLFEEIIAKGVYHEDQVKRIPREIFKKYFIPSVKEKHYQIIEEIRNAVSYEKHDLTSLNPIGKDFGIVLCKNVLLHLSYQERVEVIKMFHKSLIKGGYFATEQTQQLPREVENLFEPVVSNAKLYKKI